MRARFLPELDNAFARPRLLDARARRSARRCWPSCAPRPARPTRCSISSPGSARCRRRRRRGGCGGCRGRPTRRPRSRRCSSADPAAVLGGRAGIRRDDCRLPAPSSTASSPTTGSGARTSGTSGRCRWEAGPEQALALVDSMRHMPDENSPDARHERLASDPRRRRPTRMRARPRRRRDPTRRHSTSPCSPRPASSRCGSRPS